MDTDPSLIGFIWLILAKQYEGTNWQYLWLILAIIAFLHSILKDFAG